MATETVTFYEVQNVDSRKLPDIWCEDCVADIFGADQVRPLITKLPDVYGPTQCGRCGAPKKSEVRPFGKPIPEPKFCPGCDRRMSDREAGEQGNCNDCAEGR